MNGYVYNNSRSTKDQRKQGSLWWVAGDWEKNYYQRSKAKLLWGVWKASKRKLITKFKQNSGVKTTARWGQITVFL